MSQGLTQCLLFGVLVIVVSRFVDDVLFEGHASLLLLVDWWMMHALHCALSIGPRCVPGAQRNSISFSLPSFPIYFDWLRILGIFPFPGPFPLSSQSDFTVDDKQYQ